MLLLRNLCNLRDEFGSATSRDTTRRSLRRPLLLLACGAFDTTGLVISPSGSIMFSFVVCFIVLRSVRDRRYLGTDAREDDYWNTQ